MDTIYVPEVDLTQGKKYQSLLDAIQRDVDSGVLKAGDQLPAIRALAWALGVTPGTVARAYQDGVNSGLFEATTGRGTFIAHQGKNADAPPFDADDADAPIDLMTANTPYVGQDRYFSEALDRIAKDSLRQIHMYPRRMDRHHIYERLVEWLEPHGVSTSPVRVVLTHGGQNALEFTLRALVESGVKTIALDALTYPGLRLALTGANLDQVDIAMDEQGIIPEALEEACQTRKIQALFTSANIINPTAGHMTLERRKKIAELARRYDFQIIEDDCWCIRPLGIPSFQQLCPENGWYLSSFSKGIAAGMRFGFIVPPAHFTVILRKLIRVSSYGVSRLIADLAYELMRSGDAQLIREKVLAAMNERIEIAHRVLKDWSFNSQKDTGFIWLSLPNSWRISSFVMACERHKVVVRPPEEFLASNAPAPSAVRISMNCNISVERFTQGLEQINELLHNPPVDLSA